MHIGKNPKQTKKASTEKKINNPHSNDDSAPLSVVALLPKQPHAGAMTHSWLIHWIGGTKQPPLSSSSSSTRPMLHLSKG